MAYSHGTGSLCNSSKKHIIFVALLCVAFAVSLRVAFDQTPATPDFARDLLIAKDCVAGAGCHTRGADTSFGGLLQGAGFNHLLSLLMLTGLSTDGIVSVVFALHGLSLLVMFLAGGRIGGVIGGWMTMSVWASGSLLLSSYPQIFNFALIFLPLALFFASLEEVSAGGRFVWALVAAAALWFCTEIHVLSWMLLPALMFVVAARARWCIESILSVIGIIALCAGLSSSDALIANFRTIHQAGLLIPIGLVPALALAAGLAVRHFKRPDVVKVRSGVISLVVGASGLSCLFVVALLVGRDLNGRYALVFLPGLVLALTLVMSQKGELSFAPASGRARVVTAMAVILLCFGYVTGYLVVQGRSRPALPVGEFGRIHSEFLRAGFGYADLTTGLHGQQADIFLQYVGLEAGYPLPPPRPRPEGLFFVVTDTAAGPVSGASSPGFYRTLSLNRDHDLVWWIARPLITGRGVSVCFKERNSSLTGPVCDTADIGGPLFHSPSLSYGDRAALVPLESSAVVADVNRRRADGTLTLRIPLDPPPDGRPQALLVYGDWTLVEVSGSGNTISAADRLVIVSNPGSGFELTVSRDVDFGNGSSVISNIPDWIQIDVADLAAFSRVMTQSTGPIS